LDVEAYRIYNSLEADCPLHQYAQWYNQYTELWEDLRDNDFVTMHMDEHYFTISISQKLYLDELEYLFGAGDGKTITINVRFVTFNPAND
jgi:hypothetical protein